MRGFRPSERKSLLMPARKYPKALVEWVVRPAICAGQPVSHVATLLGLPARDGAKARPSG